MKMDALQKERKVSVDMIQYEKDVDKEAALSRWFDDCNVWGRDRYDPNKPCCSGLTARNVPRCNSDPYRYRWHVRVVCLTWGDRVDRDTDCPNVESAIGDEELSDEYAMKMDALQKEGKLDVDMIQYEKDVDKEVALSRGGWSSCNGWGKDRYNPNKGCCPGLVARNVPRCNSDPYRHRWYSRVVCLRWNDRVDRDTDCPHTESEIAIAKKQHPQYALNMDALHKEEASGFLSLTHSMWLEILAAIGLLAVFRSIYSVCIRKSGDSYQNVSQEV